jgi:hypothetical protein
MNEVWEDIIGYEGFYQVSDLGRVKSLRFNKEIILKFGVDWSGYLLVNLFKNGIPKNMKAHRLVALTFIPNPENKLEVNHKDGIKTNNNIENLEWSTRAENCLHAWGVGLSKGNSRLKESEVLQIRDLYKSERFNQMEIAELYNCSKRNIYKIVNRETWEYI